MMFDVFKKHISDKISLTDEEMEYASGFFIRRIIRKKDFLLHEGDPCLYNSFIEEGGLRAYTIDEKGKEHISIFAFEGNWIADLSSYCSGRPARFSIDAVEDSSALLLSFQKGETLCREIPKFERYFRILYQKSIANLAYKLDDLSKLSAKEKYDALLSQQPDIFQRLPLYQIASYLGITPESLSRIRK